MSLVRLLRPLPAARGAGIVLPATIIAAFAVFGVLLSLWVMIAYRPFGGLDFRRVVLLTQSTAGEDSNFIPASNSTLIEVRARSFTAVVRVRLSPLYARTREGSQPIHVALVSPEFLDLFKAEIIRGRGLENRDDPWPADGAAGVVSQSWWREHMGGAGDVPGRRVATYDWTLPSVPIVGVLSERFRGFGLFTDEPVDLVLPFPLHLPNGGLNPVPCIALTMLAPGATIDSARRDVAAIGAELKREGLVDRTTTFAVRPASALFRPVRQRLALATMATAIAFLLVLVCAAGVLQVRAVDRTGEISIRLALGAGRRDIIFMLIGENLRLFLVTALAGSALASVAIRKFGPILAGGIGLPSAVDPASGRWLPFSTVALVPLVALCVAAAQFAMLIPAYRGGPVSTRSRWTPGRVALRRAAVLLQCAAATGLAFAAVASIHALVTVERRGLGFETAHLLSARVSLPLLGSDSPLRWESFYNSLVEELKRLPGVRSVGVMRGQPGEKRTPGILKPVEPLTAAVAATPVFAVEEIVHPSFFREMGIPTLAGRLCDVARPQDGQPVDVINEAMAQRYWPNGDALGKHLRGYGGTAKIIGIVPSLRNSLLEAMPGPEVFVCFPIQGMHLMIRHSGGERVLQGALPPIVRRLDPDAAIDDIVSVDDLLDRSLRPSKALAGFLGSLAAMAVAVAALGLFAIAAMVIGQRRTELAVRIAVGADPAALGRTIEGEALALGSFGIAGGWLLYSAVSRYFTPLGVELDLPWHMGAQSAGALLALMWLAVKRPAHGLRRMDVMAELKRE